MTQSLNLPQKGFYYHYKHDAKKEFNNYVYEVMGIGRNTEDKTYTVLYRPMYKNDWFSPADAQSRPLNMFNECVEVNGVIMPRFKKIEDEAIVMRLDEIKLEMYGSSLQLYFIKFILFATEGRIARELNGDSC